MKYKHKTKGYIATKSETLVDYYEVESFPTAIPSTLIEDSCDWEEVVEKDYEILSFRRNKDSKYEGTQFNLTPNGLYNPNFKVSDLSLEHCLNGGFDIWKIKRLSDGEVFTVGDRAITKFSDYGIIVEFENKFNNIYITTKKGKNRCMLKDLKPIKKPIFTTEDGVELIAGDRYYVPQVEGKLRRLTGSEIMFYVEPDMPEDETKRFAKKENAQAYIENNIELFSAKDIYELLKKYSRMMVDSSIYLELSKMVKERLNN